MANVAQQDTNSFDELDVFVGKDVLELLSTSMYVNPLAIFREYVQNATDAIDDAVDSGLLPSISDGLIEINIDHIDRRVIIRDNGIGLSNKEFPSRMLSFGASKKRGTDARGFRGVGRLAGLGYVQQLIFRSRTKGDAKVFEAIWDGRVIKRMLSANHADADLREIVRESVTLNRKSPEDYSKHFFEVELIKPRRIANDRLLNESEIEAFIGQICPCPFAPSFPLSEDINAFLDKYGRAGRCYNIHINGEDQPVYRPYGEYIEHSDTKKSYLDKKVKKLEIPSADGSAAAVVWFVHHDYLGAIPPSLGVGGLRGRVGNTQIGHERLFYEVFPEDRFCSWTIGEVHVLDRRVVPNGRRDEFEGNIHLDNIIMHLRQVGAEVARECRLSSQRRTRLKAFDLDEDKIYGKLEILKQGAITKNFEKSIRNEIDKLLIEMCNILEFDLFEDKDKIELRSRLASIKEAVGRQTAKVKDDTLDNLPTYKRSVYREIFGLIYDCSANQATAKNLIDRVLERLSRQ